MRHRRARRRGLLKAGPRAIWRGTQDSRAAPENTHTMETEPIRRPRFDLSRILVIDLEATCWQGALPPGQEHDIIEIGNAILHTGELRVEPGPEILIRPARSRVSEFCTELTGITQEMLDEKGVPLADGIRALREAHGDIARVVWASYGEYDRRKLQADCESLGIPYPLGDTHINVKRLVALVAGWSRERGMMETLKRLHIEPMPGGRHHRGCDDALNIARLLAVVLRGLRS